MLVQVEQQIVQDILEDNMIYRDKILDIRTNNLLFYSGEVHTNHICNVFTYNKRRTNERR